MNTVAISGRVGTDIELRYTPKGQAVTELNLAVSDGFGENRKTVWVAVIIWGLTAETAAKYVRKGDRLEIEGRLTQDEWINKTTGKKERKTKVTCQAMHLVEPKRADAGESDPIVRPNAATATPAANSSPPDDDDGDELPF